MSGGWKNLDFDFGKKIFKKKLKKYTFFFWKTDFKSRTSNFHYNPTFTIFSLSSTRTLMLIQGRLERTETNIMHFK